GDRLVAVADTASPPVWTSIDGVHWQHARFGPANVEISSVAVDGSEFVASGSLVSKRRPEVCHSSDGTQWSCAAVPVKGNVASVAAAGDQQVATGLGLSASI